jgi:hypothetical protein
VALFLLGQPAEFAVEWVLRMEKRFLAVQNLGIGGGGEVETVQLPCAQRQPDGAQQGRMRIGLEVGVDEVGNLAGPPMNLDEVRPFDFAKDGPAAALVDAQEWLQSIQGAAVDVQVVWQQLADPGALAGLVDGGRVAGLEQQCAWFRAGFGVGAKELFDVALKSKGHLRPPSRFPKRARASKPGDLPNALAKAPKPDGVQQVAAAVAAVKQLFTEVDRGSVDDYRVEQVL